MSQSGSRDVGNGRKTVATAGTREPLITGDAKVLSVTIKALRANAGKVYVGDVSVSSTVGFELDAGDSVDLATDDPSKPIDLTTIYLDVGTSGEGVTFIYVRE